MKPRFALALLAAILFYPALLTIADEKPATEKAPEKPTLEATDKKAIEANLNKDAIVVGKVLESAWTRSGNIFFINFEGNKRGSGDFVAIAKKENREALDKAFDGDLAKAITGKKISVDGKITPFTGRDGTATPQIEITTPDQLKILEEPTTQKKD